MAITLWVTAFSLLTLVVLEKLAALLYGSPLPRRQRWLLPVPMVAILASNLDGVLSLGAWLETHPLGFAIRYSGNEAWSSDRFFYLGFLAVLIIPCLHKASLVRVAQYSILWCFFHLLWLAFVWCPLALATGLPLRQ